MQTILYKTIGNYQIITGFSKLTQDPAETKKKIAPLLLEDPKIKRIGDLIIQSQKLKEAIKQINVIIRSAGKIYPSEVQKKQIEDYKEQIEDIAQELRELEKYRKQKTDEYKNTNAVYFNPSPREIVKTDEEIETLKEQFANLPENYYLDINGNQIPDFSKYKYWIKTGDKWEQVSYCFGETPDPLAIMVDKLTEADISEINGQLEKERIALLSPADKESEKDKVIIQLSLDAVKKKEAMEIQGVTAETAMAQAREWYNEQVAIVEAKYG